MLISYAINHRLQQCSSLSLRNRMSLCLRRLPICSITAPVCPSPQSSLVTGPRFFSTRDSLHCWIPPLLARSLMSAKNLPGLSIHANPLPCDFSQKSPTDLPEINAGEVVVHPTTRRFQGDAGPWVPSTTICQPTFVSKSVIQLCPNPCQSPTENPTRNIIPNLSYRVTYFVSFL